MFVCGRTTGGRLGIHRSVGVHRTGVCTPKPLPLRRVNFVCCGYTYTLFIMSNGEIYETGTLKGRKITNYPTRIDSLKMYQIDYAISTYNFAIARSKCGKVFSWGITSFFQILLVSGDNNRGQLGIHGVYILEEPTIIPFFKEKTVTVIGAGDFHSLVATTENKIYGFGDKAYLGLGSQGQTSYPVEIKSMRNKIPKKIVSSYHTAILTIDGKLFFAGDNT